MIKEEEIRKILARAISNILEEVWTSYGLGEVSSKTLSEAIQKQIKELDLHPQMEKLLFLLLRYHAEEVKEWAQEQLY